MERNAKLYLDLGDAEALEAALAEDPGLATRPFSAWEGAKTGALQYLPLPMRAMGLTATAACRLAEVLTRYGASIDEPDADGLTPLTAAACPPAQELALWYLDRGADIEQPGTFGGRALHWACWTGAAALTSALLERGAAVEPRCARFGATPLFWAAHGWGQGGADNRAAQHECARLMLSHGADRSARNRWGETMQAMLDPAHDGDFLALLTP